MSKDENPFDGPQLQDQTYERADMSRTKFDGVNLHESEFWAVLTNCKFTDCNMSDMIIDNANLANLDLHNVNLSSMKIRNANLSKVDIAEANLERMKINGVLVSDLFAAYEEKQG